MGVVNTIVPILLPVQYVAVLPSTYWWKTIRLVLVKLIVYIYFFIHYNLTCWRRNYGLLRISSSCRHLKDIEETIILLILGQNIFLSRLSVTIKKTVIIFLIIFFLHIQDKKCKRTQKYLFKFVSLCGCTVHELFEGYGDWSVLVWYCLE